MYKRQVVACVIFSLYASSQPSVDAEASAISMAWSYMEGLILNMLILTATVKASDHVVREMMAPRAAARNWKTPRQLPGRGGSDIMVFFALGCKKDHRDQAGKDLGHRDGPPDAVDPQDQGQEQHRQGLKDQRAQKGDGGRNAAVV